MSITIRLSAFGFLAVNGKDAKSFLQGYTTCDVNRISESDNLGAICNLQGQMVTNFRIAETADGLLLRMHASRVPDTMTFLSKYIVFSKAKLIDVSDAWACFGVVGSDDELAKSEDHRLWVSEDRFELWTRDSDRIEPDAGEEIWLQQEALEGFAWVETSTADQFLPQMFNLHNLNGIDFGKGCYLGQEIIARAQYRGNLKRRLHFGRPEAVHRVGSDLQAKGKTVGRVVASTRGRLLAVVQNSDGDSLDVQTSTGESFSLLPVAPEPAVADP